jgi:hypothetical protein
VAHILCIGSFADCQEAASDAAIEDLGSSTPRTTRDRTLCPGRVRRDEESSAGLRYSGAPQNQRDDERKTVGDPISDGASSSAGVHQRQMSCTARSSSV